MRSRSHVLRNQPTPPLQLPFGGGVASRSTKTGGAGGACTPRIKNRCNNGALP